MKYHSTTSRYGTFYGQSIKTTRNVLEVMGYKLVRDIKGIRRLVRIAR